MFIKLREPTRLLLGTPWRLGALGPDLKDEQQENGKQAAEHGDSPPSEKSTAELSKNLGAATSLPATPARDAAAAMNWPKLTSRPVTQWQPPKACFSSRQ